jgi:hypothetical protein
LDSVSELAFSAVLDGAGLSGDSIGITDTQCITTTGTTRGATRSTTVAISTEVAAFAAEVSLGAAEFTTVLARRTGLSTGTPARLGDTLHPAVKAAFDPAPSAATIMADTHGANRHAEDPASVAAELVVVVVAVAAGIGNRGFVMGSGR